MENEIPSKKVKLENDTSGLGGVYDSPLAYARHQQDSNGHYRNTPPVSDGSVVAYGNTMPGEPTTTDGYSTNPQNQISFEQSFAAWSSQMQYIGGHTADNANSYPPTAGLMQGDSASQLQLAQYSGTGSASATMEQYSYNSRLMAMTAGGMHVPQPDAHSQYGASSTSAAADMGNQFGSSHSHSYGSLYDGNIFDQTSQQLTYSQGQMIPPSLFQTAGVQSQAWSNMSANRLGHAGYSGGGCGTYLQNDYHHQDRKPYMNNFASASTYGPGYNEWTYRRSYNHPSPSTGAFPPANYLGYPGPSPMPSLKFDARSPGPQTPDPNSSNPAPTIPVPAISQELVKAEDHDIASQFLNIEQRMSQELTSLVFGGKVYIIYNPLEYVFDMHSRFVRKFCSHKKKILFLGMNPGPYGMVQTGVPFGEVSIVRDWLEVDGEVNKPKIEHPKRPVLGLDCKRREISGDRFWSFFKRICGKPRNFFQYSFVHNICPILFLAESGKNITPADLPSAERRPLNDICDRYLCEVVRLLDCKMIVGIGKYAQQRAAEALEKGGIQGVRVETIMHPSPANPLANKGWDEIAARTLTELGITGYFQDNVEIMQSGRPLL